MIFVADNSSLATPTKRDINPMLKRLSEKAAFLFTFKFQIKIIRQIYLGHLSEKHLAPLLVLQGFMKN